MKIQELFEDTRMYGTFIGYISFKNTDLKRDSFHDIIKGRVSFGKLIQYVSVDYKTLVSFRLVSVPPENFSSRETLQNYLDEVSNAMIEILKDKFPQIELDETSGVLHLPQMPTKEVEWDKIFLDFITPQSLQYSATVFKNAKVITISQEKMISSNVLGLVRLNANIHCLSKNSDNKWFSIITPFLKSHDVLEAQEALIDAGLKDYAKL